MVIIFKCLSLIKIFFLLSGIKVSLLLKCLFIQQVSPFIDFINFPIKIVLIFCTKIIIMLGIQTAKMYFSLLDFGRQNI